MNPRNFVYSSDYPMPALVWEYSGSITNIGSYSLKSVNITHNLPFIPLLIGMWSENSNFNPAYDIANYIGPANLNGNLQLNQCGADSTKVVVEGSNMTGSTKSLYFKLLAFAPPDYAGEVPNIYDTTNFMFNTDYNYPLIVKSGTAALSAGGSTTVQHGLGYVPQAKVWGPDTNGRITQLFRINSPNWVDGTYGPLIDADKLTIRSRNAGTCYYHIYGGDSNVDS